MSPLVRISRWRHRDTEDREIERLQDRAIVKKLWVIASVLVVLSFYAPGTALALSCVAPTMNESVVEGAEVIFEGLTSRDRRLRRAEKAALKAAGLAPLGGGIDDLRVFQFTVTKGWKGAVDGQEVQVLRNTYWGDSFATAGLYLVVGVQAVDDLYLAPLCGNTMYFGTARDPTTLKALERLVGIGAHIKIRPEDRACRSDGDCAVIQTHCGACSCGTPVAGAALAQIQALYEQACTPFEGEICEIHCETVVPRCRQGLCALE